MLTNPYIIHIDPAHHSQTHIINNASHMPVFYIINATILISSLCRTDLHNRIAFSINTFPNRLHAFKPNVNLNNAATHHTSKTKYICHTIR